MTMSAEQVSLKPGDLVGRWRKSSSVYELRADGVAVIPTDDQVEQGTWQWVDATHWRLRTVIPPQPEIPGLEDGAVDVQEYEVIELSSTHMRTKVFDYEFDFLFSRIP